jgi:phage gpG-like protein
MKIFTLHEMADFLVSAAMIKQLEHGEHEALEWIGRVVEAEAKSAIGTYRYNWPQLAESTQAERAHEGYPANEPLLRSGEMRDSIGHVVGDHEVQVGSNSDIAVYQELGTKSIPPRSFLVNAVKASIPAIKEISGIAIGAAIASRNIEAEIIRMAIHAAKHLVHDVKEMIPDEDEHQQHKH